MPSSSLKKLIFLAFISLSLANAEESPKKDEEKKIDVFAETLKEAELFDPIAYGGFVEPKQQFTLISEVNGTVVSLAVHAGQMVKKGQALMRVRPQGLGRTFQDQVVASPIAGQIVRLPVKLGTNVSQQNGTVLSVIAKDKNLTTKVNVTAADLPFFEKRIPILIQMQGDEEAPFQISANVLEITPAADPTTSTFPVELELIFTDKAELKKHFRIGSYVSVILKKNRRNGLLVPLTALNRNRDKAYSIDKDGKIAVNKIETGNIYGRNIEVLSGLKTGIQLITKYADKPEGGELANIQKPTDRSKVSTAPVKKEQAGG